MGASAYVTNLLCISWNDCC